MKDQEQYILDLLHSELKPFSLNDIIRQIPIEYYRTENNSFESLKGNIQMLLRKQLIKSTKAWIFWDSTNLPEYGTAYHVPGFENTVTWKWNYCKKKIRHTLRESSRKFQDGIFSVFNVRFTKVSCTCGECMKLSINKEWMGARLYAFKGFRMFVGEFK